MAKKIYAGEDDVNEILATLRTSVLGKKCYGGINIKHSFKSDERFGFLYFTADAWMKMTSLVSRFTTEVQWHGLTRRISEFEFEIYDIIVPPHEVTAATVTSDQKEYNEWINALDDETFNAMHFHGHSHVNMHVSPSGVDDKYRNDVVTQLPKPTKGEDVYYIFLIINRQHEWSAEIYDLTNNALYSTDDIGIEVQVGDTTIDKFIQEAKKVAIERKYTNGYAAGFAGPYGHQAKVVTPAANAVQANAKTNNQYGNTQQKNGKNNTANNTGKKVANQQNDELPVRTGGPCCGFDTWADYYKALYAEGYNTR